MKRWAILTVLLYALALLVLTAPVTLIAFGNWGLHKDPDWIKDALLIYANGAYWIWFGVLAAGQALFLLLPIDLSERRLPTRRKLAVPIIVTTFFLAILVFASLLAIALAIFSLLPTTNNSGSSVLFTMIFTVLIAWLFWALIFRRATRSDSPDALLKRAMNWLIRGSILELIIAVPSHVIVRRRDDCCAPIGTFWGIATGISVMLLCFGPGVYFLFVERCRKLKPKSSRTNSDITPLG